MKQYNEHQLISRIILYDDHKAFEMLMNLHENGIKNLLLKLLNFNDSELDDLFQDTSTKIYRSIKNFKGDSKFATWVYKITYTTFLNHYKKNHRFQNLKEIHTENNVSKIEPAQDVKMDVEKMISILRPEEKVAIQLSYIQGFSHKDIAVVLNCPVGTVKSQIKRGRERIANTFKTYKT